MIVRSSQRIKECSERGFYGEYKRGQITKCSDSEGRKDMNGDSEESDDISRNSKDTEDKSTENKGSERQDSDSKGSERSSESKGSEKNVVRTGVVLGLIAGTGVARTK